MRSAEEHSQRQRPQEEVSELLPLTVYEYDRDNTQEELSFYCSAADFVFNLAGINRPKDPSEFMEGNMGFGETLLSCLSTTTTSAR